MDGWRARMAARLLKSAADRAIYAVPGEKTTRVCKLAWSVVEVASEAEGLCVTRKLLVDIITKGFAAEQMLR